MESNNGNFEGNNPQPDVNPVPQPDANSVMQPDAGSASQAENMNTVSEQNVAGQQSDNQSGYDQTVYAQGNSYYQQNGYDPQTGYYQQNAYTDYYNNQPNQGYPYQGNPQPQPENTGKKKEKKPLTKGKKIGIICGGVAALVLILCGIIFLPGLLKSDKDRVVEAFKETFSEENIIAASPLNDILGLSDMSKEIDEKGGELSFDFTLESVAGNPQLSGLSAGLNYAMDKEAKLFNIGCFLGNNGKNLLTFDIYADEDYTYISIPEILDEYISFNNKNFVTSFNNSFLASDEYMGPIEDTEDFDIDYFKDGKDIQEEYSDVYGAFYAGVGDVFDTLWEDATVDSDGKETIQLGDKSVKCKKYNVVFTEEALEKALQSMLDSYGEMLSSNDLAEFYADSDVSPEEMEQSMEMLKSFVPSLITGDLNVSIYLKDGQVVCIHTEDDVENALLGLEFSYEGYIRFTGEENILSDYEAGFILSADGEEFGLTLNNSTDETSEGFVQTLLIQVVGNDEAVVEASDILTYKASDNSVNRELSLTVDGMDEMIDIVCEGRYTNIVKGSCFELVYDNISVYYLGTEYVSLSMNVSEGVIQETPSGMDGTAEAVNLFEISEEEFEELIMDNYNNIMTFSQNLDEFIVNLELGSGSSYY